MKFRLEKDTLGKVRVPKSALYGAQTARAIRNFRISGRSIHPELLEAYFHIKRAAALANAKCGALSKHKARLIVRAIDSISAHTIHREFPVDPYQAGAGTNVNMNVNEVIANIANKKSGRYSPIHPNDDVNCSQSTNDTFPTAMRLSLLAASRPLAEALGLLSAALELRANRWRCIPKAGRTHLQDAVPMTLGQEFLGYAKTVRRCEEWVKLGRTNLLELGIGGSAVGTGLNVPKRYSAFMISELRRMTGEPVYLSDNLFEAMQSQNPVLFFSSMLRLVALEMTRICNDLRLLASGPMTGLQEILLPAVQPGSSIMPGKVNPSILEMANQAWFSIIGFDQTIAYCSQAGQLELNVMMPIMAHTSLDAVTIAAAAVAALRARCIEGLKPNVPRLKKNFESTPQVATALVPILGYEAVAGLVKESLKTGESVIDLAKRKYSGRGVSERWLDSLAGSLLPSS